MTVVANPLPIADSSCRHYYLLYQFYSQMTKNYKSRRNYSSEISLPTNIMKLFITGITLLIIPTTSAFRNPNEPSDPITKILKEEPIKLPAEAPPIVNKILKTSDECSVDYWARSDIHTLGNVGFGGALHAVMAPLATKVSFYRTCESISSLILKLKYFLYSLCR